METTGAKLLRFPPRAEHSRGTNKRLRNLIILANALAWVMIAWLLRYIFS